MGCLGWETAPAGEWDPGQSKLEADWSPTGEDGSLFIAQSPAKQGSKGERRRKRGGKKNRQREEKMKEGKRQENPNSHPGRDLKGQRQLSAPPSRTPKTSLLSSPHWHLSAAQTHTQEALLRVCSSPWPCLPRSSVQGRSCWGHILLSCTVLHPCKAQHHPTGPFLQQTMEGQTQEAFSYIGPHDPNVLFHSSKAPKEPEGQAILCKALGHLCNHSSSSQSI